MKRPVRSKGCHFCNNLSKKECLTRDDNEPSDLGFGFLVKRKLEGKTVKDDSVIINLLTELL